MLLPNVALQQTRSAELAAARPSAASYAATRFAVDRATRVWWHAAGLVCAVGATLAFGRGLRAEILGGAAAGRSAGDPTAPAA